MPAAVLLALLVLAAIALVIAWFLRANPSSMARALRGAGIGDVRSVALPSGTKEWEIDAIAYD